jgi:hypothetical protein
MDVVREVEVAEEDQPEKGERQPARKAAPEMMLIASRR